MYKSFTYPLNRPSKTITELLAEPMMIGFSSAEEWQLSSFSNLYSPRKILENIDLYIPVNNKQIVTRVLNGDIQISGLSYEEALVTDLNTSMLIESSLSHDYFLTPILRALGIYTNIIYAQGVATDKDYYLGNELNGDAIFLQTFKPLYRKPKTTQTVKIVFSLSLNTTDNWFADDVHWVNDTDFIY